MMHDLYIFGSAVRGEASSTSDIDVLAIPLSNDRFGFPVGWSVYSPKVIRSYFESGRLFAWHLYLEAKCIYSANTKPYLSSLGEPAAYVSASEDIEELEGLLHESLTQIQDGTTNLVYELGITYTAIRDIAMAASWILLDRPCFSRDAPFHLPNPCPIPQKTYKGAMLARHSSTRGSDYDIQAEEVATDLLAAPLISWVEDIRNSV